MINLSVPCKIQVMGQLNGYKGGYEYNNHVISKFIKPDSIITISDWRPVDGIFKVTEAPSVIFNICELLRRGFIVINEPDLDPGTVYTHINWLLMHVGVSPSWASWKILVKALTLLKERPEYAASFSKQLYPKIATEVHNSPSNIERCVRYARDRSTYTALTVPEREVIFGCDPVTHKIATKHFLLCMAKFLWREVHDDESPADALYRLTK